MSATAWLRQCVALFLSAGNAADTLAGQRGIPVVTRLTQGRLDWNSIYNRLRLWRGNLLSYSNGILVHTETEESEVSFQRVVMPNFKHSVSKTARSRH